MHNFLRYLRQRPWGIRLLAAFVLLTWPLILVALVIMAAIEDGVFSNIRGDLKEVARSLITGRI